MAEGAGLVKISGFKWRGNPYEIRTVARAQTSNVVVLRDLGKK